MLATSRYGLRAEFFGNLALDHGIVIIGLSGAAEFFSHKAFFGYEFIDYSLKIGQMRTISYCQSLDSLAALPCAQLVFWRNDAVGCAYYCGVPDGSACIARALHSHKFGPQDVDVARGEGQGESAVALRRATHAQVEFREGLFAQSGESAAKNGFGYAERVTDRVHGAVDGYAGADRKLRMGGQKAGGGRNAERPAYYGYLAILLKLLHKGGRKCGLPVVPHGNDPVAFLLQRGKRLFVHTPSGKDEYGALRRIRVSRRKYVKFHWLSGLCQRWSWPRSG